MSDAKSEDAGAGFAAWIEGLNAEAARLGLNPAYWPMTREQVESHPTPFRYGSAEDVNELRLDIPATVIATDDEGGFLLFFPDDLTQPTGAAAMADQFEHDPAARDPRDVIDNAEQQQKAQQEPAPAARAPEIDAEEEKRRAGRGGGDMGNPTHAQLGANIRPEVGSGPAGLETYTTQKSVDYHAVDPKTEKVSD